MSFTHGRRSKTARTVFPAMIPVPVEAKAQQLTFAPPNSERTSCGDCLSVNLQRHRNSIWCRASSPPRLIASATSPAFAQHVTHAPFFIAHHHQRREIKPASALDDLRRTVDVLTNLLDQLFAAFKSLSSSVTSAMDLRRRRGPRCSSLLLASEHLPVFANISPY